MGRGKTRPEGPSTYLTSMGRGTGAEGPGAGDSQGAWAGQAGRVRRHMDFSCWGAAVGNLGSTKHLAKDCGPNPQKY